MRLAALNVVDGPVPAPDGAVVHPQLVQSWNVAAPEDGGGILVVAHRQQCREVADVLFEVVEHRRDPPLAEPDARPDSLRLELCGAGVRGLFEQRDTRFSPELLAEQE